MIVFRSVFIGIVFFISLSVKGQIDSIASAKYDFVNYSENVIHFYSDSANLDSFYKKLDTLLK